MRGRRDFLKVFGLSSAMAVTVTTDKGAEFEKVTATEPVTPLEHLPLFSGHYLTGDYDVIDGQLYSSLEIGKGQCLLSTQRQFFSYGCSPHTVDMLSGRWPDLRDTNLWRGWALDAPEMFAVKRIGLVFSPLCNPKDRSEMVDKFSISLWLGQKFYDRAPLSDLFCVGEPLPKETNRLNPEFPMKYMRELSLPVVIQAMQHFYVQLEGAPQFCPEHYMKMWAVLGGMHARGVQ